MPTKIKKATKPRYFVDDASDKDGQNFMVYDRLTDKLMEDGTGATSFRNEDAADEFANELNAGTFIPGKPTKPKATQAGVNRLLRGTVDALKRMKLPRITLSLFEVESVKGGNKHRSIATSKCLTYRQIVRAKDKRHAAKIGFDHMEELVTRNLQAPPILQVNSVVDTGAAGVCYVVNDGQNYHQRKDRLIFPISFDIKLGGRKVRSHSVRNVSEELSVMKAFRKQNPSAKQINREVYSLPV